MITETVPLMVFVLVGLFSPGPNVVMLTVSGARFGFRATIPHLLGVPFGTGLLAASSAFGLNVLLLTHPALNLFFQILAAVWIFSWHGKQPLQEGLLKLKTVEFHLPFFRQSYFKP